MTPLSRLLSRYLPEKAVPCALALLYGLILLAVLLCAGREPADILYLDVAGGQ